MVMVKQTVSDIVKEAEQEGLVSKKLYSLVDANKTKAKKSRKKYAKKIKVRT